MQLVRPGCEENLQGYPSQWPGAGAGSSQLVLWALICKVIPFATLSRDPVWASPSSSTCPPPAILDTDTWAADMDGLGMDGCWDFVEKIHIFVSGLGLGLGKIRAYNTTT